MNLKAIVRAMALASLFLFSVGVAGCSDLLVDSADGKHQGANTATEDGPPPGDPPEPNG